MTWRRSAVSSRPSEPLAAARDRRDETYDPALADLFLEHGAAWFERLRETEPWDAVLALEPEPRRTLEGEALDHALEVAADFIDLKSSYWGGHSRRCAQLAAMPPAYSGFPEEDTTALRRAALVHDFGTSAVPNSIWDKPGPLTRTEFDRVELHPMLTEQMLRRSPALATLTRPPRRITRSATGRATTSGCEPTPAIAARCVLAATEIYVGMTTERADRPRFADDEAAAELRRLESDGVLEPSATRAVLVAAGHGEPDARGGSGRRIGAGCRAGKSTCCSSPRAASRPARSPTGSSSPRRPPTTTSSTSTPRSASRPEPPPLSGRCRTTTSSVEAC